MLQVQIPTAGSPGTHGSAAVESIAVPASLLDVVGEGAAIVVKTMDPSLTAELTGTQANEENPAKAAVIINVMGASGERIEIGGLADPIEVVFTVSTNDSLGCAFVDETEGRWSAVGVWRHAFADGRLICRTSHLTIFGAVLDGFLSAFRCTQASLLSKEGYQALVNTPNWYYQTPCLILWVVLLALSSVQFLACLVDCRRRDNAWTDDCWLIVGEEDAGEEEETDLEKQVANNADVACCLCCCHR